MDATRRLILVSCLFLALLLACSPAKPVPTETGKPPVPSAPAAPKQTASVSPTVKPTSAPAAAPFSFAGKTITLVVTTVAGGGTDIIARIYARHLPNLLPGKPTVIVRNMPGGNNTVGANHVYSSRPDGLTLLVAGSTVFLPYVTRMAAVKFDLLKMEAIVAYTGGGIYFAKSGIVDKVEDLPKARGIIFGHTSGSAGWIFATTVSLLEMKPEKVVLAYTGGGDARRAFFSGEVNMSFGDGPAYWEVIHPYVEKNEIRNVFQSGIIGQRGEIVKDPGFPPDVPTIKEAYDRIYGKAPTGPAWEAYRSMVAVGRSYGETLLTPPGMPANILKVFWDTAGQMVKDPAFRKDVDALVGKEAPWMAGEGFSRDFKANMVVDVKVVDWLRTTLNQYGVVIQ